MAITPTHPIVKRITELADVADAEGCAEISDALAVVARSAVLLPAEVAKAVNDAQHQILNAVMVALGAGDHYVRGGSDRHTL